MTRLQFCTDLGPARWLSASRTPIWQLLTFGPSGFAASARLRFIPDPQAPGQHEADVEVSDEHPSDLEQTRRALRVLGGFTTTPQECYFCLWEGYSNALVPPQVAHGPMVELPYRRYALLRGALDDIDAWADELGDGHPIAPPAFVWPADHRWCLAGDVDPHWAGIGADQAAVDALVGDPGLDVVPADPARDQPVYR